MRSTHVGTDRACVEKSLSAHPNWKWVISKQGLEHVEHLIQEVGKRDQDAHDQYQYNDFNGYGFQEVMENEVKI